MTMFVVGCLCGVLFTVAVVGGITAWAVCSTSDEIGYDY